jgi:hypothetical protein
MIDILIGGYHVHSQKDTFETRSARKMRLKQIMSLLLKDIRYVHLIWCALAELCVYMGVQMYTH